ncbi:class I SAM-dependent methyltransferase [Flavobacterium sp. F-380]|uniref:Class I SAM-dependent methyltransferase n=1 Tax=Flavobacterium kayseriense TaxID=2764714 RepID=A0ABR7J7E2_9FLAO|nr:class I SAM-dependent methyltransferase [Flavobacterium kayseriense]MBC5841435.1 class I SAM-dependent methyltransferase [Flavobacterium kayseriense]MBC5847963.1 class I SAM-dependent methyltransferase [Flavobacterium kayseriense]
MGIKKNKWTGERIETTIYGDVTVEHLHRYSLARFFIKDKIVLDIASGEGYGSYLMAKSAKKVIGVDIDQEVIDLSSTKYKNENLSFLRGSTDLIPLDDNSVDVLISFETIEHHDKHHEMFIEIKRVLKPDGILIMSSPDKKYYSDLNKNNPFHVKELYLEEFTNLANEYFQTTTVYFQNCINGNSIIAKTDDFLKLNIVTGDYNHIIEKQLPALYNIIVASDKTFDQPDLSIFDGRIITDQIIKDKENYILNSTTFKLGKLLLKPFIVVKNNFFS